jgi:hypothetical protein
MMHRKRTIALAVIATAIVVALVLGRRWADKYARARVMSQLVELNGGAVAFDRVVLGLRGLTIYDAQLFERNDGRQITWCSVHRIWMNISIWNGLMGKTSSERAILERPVVRLRLAEDGKLLSKFGNSKGGMAPPAEQITIRDATVQIEQARRPRFLVRRIDATVLDKAGELVIDGRIGDLLESEWVWKAAIDAKTLGAAGTMSSEHVAFSSAALATVPVIGVDVRQYGDFKASGSAKASLSWAPTEGLRYDAAFAVKAVQASVGKIDIDTSISAGRLTAKNGLLTLSDLRGEVVGGEYTASGSFELPKADGSLRFRMAGLQASRLPRSWNLPREVEANLSGTGEVTIGWRDRVWNVRGNAQGEVDEVVAYGAKPEAIEFKIEFNSPGDRKRHLPLGVG